MRLNDEDLIDFSTVPTTPEDLAMLRAVRELDRLDPQQSLEFLIAFRTNPKLAVATLVRE